MIVFDNTSFSYHKNKPVLSNLNLEIKDGTICGLLGRNGVGKSTMLYLMSGLIHPKTGRVECNGHVPFNRDVTFLNDIFIVPEEFVLPSISMRRYISINACFYPKFSMEDMERILKMFNLNMDINLGALSMGQKKKAFLSFALACNTSILLLDEPTNGLDISSKREFRMALGSVMDENKIIVISTHQVYDVETILDHVVIADNNRILLNKSMVDVSSRISFNLTTDPTRAQKAIFSLQVPGGFSVAEYLTDPERETDVNLEVLFEMAQQCPDRLNDILSRPAVCPTPAIY